MENKNKHTCDSCHETPQNIIWVTGEDFTPFAGEIVTAEIYQNYDALCEPCYLKLIAK